MGLEALPVVLADDSAAYWLAGISTVAASVIVGIVMLLTDGAEDDETP